jgi:hypothetical protein
MISHTESCILTARFAARKSAEGVLGVLQRDLKC